MGKTLPKRIPSENWESEARGRDIVISKAGLAFVRDGTYYLAVPPSRSANAKRTASFLDQCRYLPNRYAPIQKMEE
jgi:hypothetical protein